MQKEQIRKAHASVMETCVFLCTKLCFLYAKSMLYFSFSVISFYNRNFMTIIKANYLTFFIDNDILLRLRSTSTTRTFTC